MDMNRMTQKTQEALHAAQVKAIRYGHQEIDGEHVMLALLEQDDGLVARLLERIGGVPSTIKARLEQELEGRPSVKGHGSESGKIYVTDRFNRMLVSAGDEADRLKDEYISVEHLLLALAAEGGKTPAGALLKGQGADKKTVLNELKAVRGYDL